MAASTIFRDGELESWSATSIILTVLAGVIFIVQRSSWALIGNLLFEVCIFYVPAVVSAVIFLYLRGRSRAEGSRVEAGPSMQ